MRLCIRGECARCGRKVRTDENYLKAHLRASTAVFHWSCFIALMKQQRETAAEESAFKGSRGYAMTVNKSSVSRPLSATRSANRR